MLNIFRAGPFQDSQAMLVFYQLNFCEFSIPFSKKKNSPHLRRTGNGADVQSEKRNGMGSGLKWEEIGKGSKKECRRQVGRFKGSVS